MRSPLEFERDALKDRVNMLTNICRNQENKIAELAKELRKHKLAGEYYLKMQKDIQDNENIRDAWLDFICIYGLATPDLREVL